MGSNPPGWWSRNWKWAAPSGCLLVVLLAFGGCAAFVVGIFGVMKNDPVYTEAVARAQASPEVAAAIGTPIETSWMLSGEINTSGDGGDAELTIPVSGPRGTGTILVEAEKSAGQWHYRVLTFKPTNGDAIDLRAEGD